MSRNRLGFGIVGCGRIAPRHANSIIEIQGAQLVAVADTVEQRACEFAKQYSTTYYTDYRYMLERNDIDIINICTPNGVHAQMAIEAMQADKHVIVEKPMALSVQDADKMLSVARSANKKMSVMLQNRYNAPVQELRCLLDEGKLGKLLLGNATVRWFRPQKYYDDNWHGTWHMDGGVLMNQAIHHVDILQWFLGEVETVFCYNGTLAHKIETDDAAVAALRFKNGALGTIESSTITFPRNLEASIAVFGELGSAKIGGTALDRKDFWEVMGIPKGEPDVTCDKSSTQSSVYGFGHKAVIANMFEAVTEQKEPLTNGVEGRKTIVLVSAMYLSSQMGHSVNVASIASNSFSDQ